MSSDTELLEEFVQHSSQQAFTELVSRYAGLVLSAVHRQVRDKSLADDISQAVFVILARKADSLSKDVYLPVWLSRTARYTAIDAIRREEARKRHEAMSMQYQDDISADDIGWEHVARYLDEVMMELREKDRKAIMLRYFQKFQFVEVSARLNVSEGAAKKTVTRALEKMRLLFAKRGLNVSTGALMTLIPANAVHEVSAEMVDAIVAVSTASATGGAVGILAKGGMRMMMWVQVKAVAATVLMAGLLCAGVVFGAVTAKKTVPGKTRSVITVTTPTMEPVCIYRSSDPNFPKSFSSGSGFEKIGDSLYLTTGGNRIGGGTIQQFKWNPNAASNKLTYVQSVSNSVLKAGISLCAAKGRLYGLGHYVWGARDGDKWPGLTWYDIQKDTGTPVEKGVLTNVQAGSWFEQMAMSPDEKNLYAYTSDRKITWVRIGANGTPEKAGGTSGPGVGSNPIMSPDGKHLYSVADHKLACIDRLPSGEIKYKNAISLNGLASNGAPRVAELKDYHPSLAGFSPDGKWMYLSLWSERPRTMNVFGIFKRDLATGDLTLQDSGTAYDGNYSGLANLHGMKLFFLPDGRGGYITTGDMLESFRFNPATGALSDITCLVPSEILGGRPRPLIVYDAKTGLIFGTAEWQIEPYGNRWIGFWVTKTGTKNVRKGGRSDITASTAAEADSKPGSDVDWPCWSGPNGDNHNPTKGIRKDWTGGLKKVWEARGFSPFVTSWSPVAVQGNKLVISGKHGLIDEVTCFDADKGGAPLWTSELFGEGGGDGWAGGPHPMPTISGDKVYVCHGSRYSCLSMKDGKMIWEKAYSTPGHAPGHPVYVWKNLAVLTHCMIKNDSKLVELAAVNKDTGEVVWTYEKPPKMFSQGYAAPVCMKINGKEQMLHNSGAFACALEPATGKQIWSFSTSKAIREGEGAKFPPMPYGSTPLVFVAGTRPTLLRVQGAITEPIWGGDFGMTWSPPLIEEDNLYGFSSGNWGIPDNKSSFWCADMKTGKTIWKKNGVSAAHVLAIDGCLLILTFEGDLMLVEPSSTEFKLITEWKGAVKGVPWWTGNDGKTPTPCWSMPTIARGKIYLRSSDRLWCYDLINK